MSVIGFTLDIISHVNTKAFIRLGIPLGEAIHPATGFVSPVILSSEDKRAQEGLTTIVRAFSEDVAATE